MQQRAMGSVAALLSVMAAPAWPAASLAQNGPAGPQPQPQAPDAPAAPDGEPAPEAPPADLESAQEPPPLPSAHMPTPAPQPAPQAPPAPPGYGESAPPAAPPQRPLPEQAWERPTGDAEDPDAPRREGFTLELGLGLGITHLSADLGASETNVGLAPLSLSLGGFFSPDVAVMFRMAGTSWFEDILGESVQLGNYFYGVAAQYWPHDHAFIGGGAGLALLDDNPLFSSNIDVESDSGLGLTLRAGYSFATMRRHSFALTAELFPAFYEGGTVVGIAFNLQWQLL